MKTAALVIDVQQGLCEGDRAAFDSAGTIARINQVTARVRNAGGPVIFVQHESGPGSLEHGSAAWQLAQGLVVQPGDHKVRKTTPDAFLRTTLLAMLDRLGIAQLVVCGMHSEFCIDTTVRRALALGYPVVLVSDGHSSMGNAVLSPQQVIAHENATLTQILGFGPRVLALPSQDLTFIC